MNTGFGRKQITISHFLLVLKLVNDALHDPKLASSSLNSLFQSITVQNTFRGGFSMLFESMELNNII
jgi:hypothetical protein